MTDLEILFVIVTLGIACLIQSFKYWDYQKKGTEPTTWEAIKLGFYSFFSGCIMFCYVVIGIGILAVIGL